jgi:hypothetical protein
MLEQVTKNGVTALCEKGTNVPFYFKTANGQYVSGYHPVHAETFRKMNEKFEEKER